MLSNVFPLILRTIGSLAWETGAVKSGASSKAPDRAIGGVGSRLCLNPTIRPPGSSPGEADQSTSFYMERVHQLRKSSCENVCGQHTSKSQWRQGLVTPVQRGAQKPDSYLSPAWAQHLPVLSSGATGCRQLPDSVNVYRVSYCFRISKSFYLCR